MTKKINAWISSIKRRVLCEINTISKMPVILTVTVIFIAGTVITLHGVNDITDSRLIFPQMTPPAFFLILGRFALHFMLGLALGILLAAGDRAAQSCAFRTAVFVSLLVLSEMIWISVFYSFAVPFFSFALSVFMLMLTVCACISAAKTVFTASLVLYVYLAFLVIRCWLSLSMVLIN